MTFHAELLENIPQTRYLSAEHYIQYRSIMRLFFLEHQKMHYQMDKNTILAHLHEEAIFAQYTSEQLNTDLDQLVSWKNLTPLQDPHKVYTIADFKNRQYQYMMTQSALEIERMTITLENLYARTTGLSSSAFRRIQSALRDADRLDGMSLKEVGIWWQDLQEDFQRMSQNYQDYLREFYGSNADRQMKSTDFLAYKQHLIRYLQEFIQELQSSSAQIGAQLDVITPARTEHLLSLVHRSELEIPRPNSQHTANWEEELRVQNAGVWQSLVGWFSGENATARQVMEVTNEVIRRVVQNASLLVQMQNMGVSNKAELRHLMELFSRCETLDESHRLSALVFGAQSSRHFYGNDEKKTERIDVSTFEEEPLEFALTPRVRTYKPRMDRSGFADKSAEKAVQRRQILEEAQQLRKQLMGYIRNGRLEFGALSEPVSPAARTVLLSWVAMANLSPDRCGRTEYGQCFKLQKNGIADCRLACTDGVLTMPNYTLVFEENVHV